MLSQKDDPGDEVRCYPVSGSMLSNIGPFVRARERARMFVVCPRGRDCYDRRVQFDWELKVSLVY